MFHGPVLSLVPRDDIRSFFSVVMGLAGLAIATHKLEGAAGLGGTAGSVLFWTAGAVFGGIGGLVGNVTGDEVWTFAGMGVSAAFAVASRFKAPAGGSDAFGSLR